MPIHIFLVGSFAVAVFGLLSLLFLQIALSPGREAQRAVEVALRPAQKKTLVAQKKRFLDGIVSIVQRVRTRLRLMPSETTARKLAMAGYWKASATDFYLAGQISLPLVFAWAGSLVHSNTVLWMFAFVSIGFLTPKLWLDRAIRNRKNRLRRDLPDAIDLLVICVDAGLGLDQAVLRVSDELIHSHPVLHEELHRVHLEQRAGRPRLETWQNLADRTTLPELALFVSLLVQADRFGTQVTKGLSTFADDLRQQQRQRAEEAVAQLKIKILFPLVFLIFPCLFIVILGPAVLSISQDLHALFN
jgi:tight adherence protein C